MGLPYLPMSMWDAIRRSQQPPPVTDYPGGQPLPPLVVTGTPDPYTPRVIQTEGPLPSPLPLIPVPYAPNVINDGPVPTLTIAGMPWWLIGIAAIGLYVALSGKSRGGRSWI